jgi:hypothetical protein
MQLARERLLRWHGHEHVELCEVVGSPGDQVTAGAKRVSRRLPGIHEQPGEDDRADRVRPELEGGDDAEVTAAAANCPEQVVMLVGPRVHDPAVREDNIGPDQ